MLKNVIQINIFGFTESRFPFTKLMMNEITKINPENKEKILLHLYCQKNDKNRWMDEIQKEKYSDIDVALHLMETSEYIDKVPIAHQTDAEFSSKIDEDCFISCHILNYIIENINLLNTEKFSVIVPLLSNGIPSLDMFLIDFLPPKEREPAYEIFKRDGLKNVLDVWGADYRGLQSFIETMDKWNPDSYWEFMESYNPIETRPHMPQNYKWAKGIHPARFSDPYHYFILDKILKNKNKIFEKQNYYIYPKKTAYLCNSVFFTTTKFWKESFALLYDGYDEGQMTIYAKMKGLVPAYVRNAFGIHMAYGGVPHQNEIEKYYIENLYQN